jgi:hypothetical protein
VNIMLSHRLKGEMESSAKTKASTPLHRFIHPSPSLRTALQIWYNLHSYIICQRERKCKGLYFTHKYPFLAIHAKGGESISPKQKDRTTTNFKNVFFQICVKKKIQLVSHFDIISNWYTLFKINS